MYHISILLHFKRWVLQSNLACPCEATLCPELDSTGEYRGDWQYNVIGFFAVVLFFFTAARGSCGAFGCHRSNLEGLCHVITAGVSMITDIVVPILKTEYIADYLGFDVALPVTPFWG